MFYTDPFRLCLSALLCLSVVGCMTPPGEDGRVDLSLVPAEQCGSWQSNTIHEPRRLEDHVIRVSRDGNMLNVRDRETIHSEEQAKEALNHMMCEAELLARSKGSSKVRILIYAHGGLNSYGSTDERILEDHQALKMMNEDDEWYYPIYISWDSSLQTSYPEHIFRLREGYKSNILVGVPTSLVVFPSDILTTVGRYPATVTYQAINDKNRFASIRYAPWLNGAWKNALLKMCDGRLCEGDKRFSGDSSPLEANLSSYFKDSGWRQAGRATYDILSLPVRYTVGSIYHSAIASSSWNVMKRRAVMPYYPASYFDGRWESGVSGGQVFPAVLSRARASKQYDYELTLVGHSMGTMVMNEALTRYRKAFLAGDELQNIVYMAAAADIGDSMAALKPILVANGAARSEPVNFYNLTLNRVAEVAEMHWLGALPTGSLLVSIDQHHEHPEHPVRRTLGSEVNVLTAIEELDEAFRGAKGDLVFKAFDRKPGEYPRHHADFSKMDFWRSDVWQLPGS